MPVFRGIDISIGSETLDEKLPEYPHPEASQVSLVHFAALEARTTGAGPTTPRKTPVKPSISVYVPAFPDIRFWVKYNILHIPHSACHLFFRLVINGRLVTSWGFDPAHSPSGDVSRALYMPGELWRSRCRQDKDPARQHQHQHQLEGIEARSFYFLQPSEKLTPAEDGGLIEVQVFRAKGRRQRAVGLEEFKSQTRYGVSFPSCGLLEESEDARFYDYFLIDPLAWPFASFCFHYRSWTSLHHLNLIPSLEIPLGLSPKKRPLAHESPAKPTPPTQIPQPVQPSPKPRSASPDKNKALPPHPYMVGSFKRKPVAGAASVPPKLALDLPPQLDLSFPPNLDFVPSQSPKIRNPLALSPQRTPSLRRAKGQVSRSPSVSPVKSTASSPSEYTRIQFRPSTAPVRMSSLAFSRTTTTSSPSPATTTTSPTTATSQSIISSSPIDDPFGPVPSSPLRRSYSTLGRPLTPFEETMFTSLQIMDRAAAASARSRGLVESSRTDVARVLFPSTRSLRKASSEASLAGASAVPRMIFSPVKLGKRAMNGVL